MTAGACLLLAGALLLAGCDTGTDTGGRTPSPSPSSPTGSSPSEPSPSEPSTSPSEGDCTVAAAGDIAGDDDYKKGAAATADLIVQQDPEAVIAVGDLAYDHGTEQEFADYYDPTWGEFKDKTLPVPGNHDNDDGDGGYSDYFGKEASANRAVEVCGWRVLLLNQYDGIDDAAQYITDEADEHPDVPMIAVWHAPRFSSGEEHGNDDNVQPIWEAAVDAGVRVVLNGHDHDYERYAEMDVEGDESDGGTREFVTGLGGHHIREFGDIDKESEARFTGTPAILFLTLRNDSYSWTVRTVDGDVVDDGIERF